jgi:acyl carrier protein
MWCGRIVPFLPWRKVKAMDRTTLRQVLLEQLQQNIDEFHGSLEDDHNLREELGLDSVDLVSLVISIQGRLGIELKSEELDNTVKVGDLLDLIQSKLTLSHSAA